MHRAVDVHGHAMPEPVLRWLETSGRADLSGLDERIVRIDSEVSGVGAGAPIPLAPSMTDPAVRIAELDELRLDAQAISLPPFLMASRSVDVDLVFELVSRGNDALVDYCGHEPTRLLPLGQVPLGWALAHQGGALIVLGFAMAHWRGFYGEYPREVADD